MSKSALVPRRDRNRRTAEPASGPAPAMLVALALALLPGLAPPQPASAAALQVKVEGERLSADVAQVPIADVLRAVAEQTGAQLSLRGELGNVQPQAFSGVPLAEALPRLAKPNGLILQFTPAGERGEARRLVFIRAVAPGAPAASPGDDSSADVRVTPPVSRQDPRRQMPAGFWDYEKSDAPLPSVEERIAMLGKIVRQRGQAAMAALAYVLASDPEQQARRAALGLLAGLGTEEARRALTQAAADHDPEVRADALRALTGGGTEKPVPLLAQAAKGDGDPRVRLAAIQLLSARDGDLARAVLQGALADQDPEVREAAQQSIRR